jgi:hypothetical protein
MTTPDLFSPRPLARNADPATSHQAAENARAFARDHYALILGVLWRPMIGPEVAMFTGLTMEQVCRRLPELEQLSQVRRTGSTRTGPKGTSCREWERCLA